MSGAVLAVMVVVMVLMCGGMLVGAGYAFIRRGKRPGR
jgi:hypothetical protein